MKKIFKWAGLVAAGLVGLVLVGVVLLYVQSERVLNRHYEVAASAAIVVPTDPAEIAEGRRIAHFTGCTHCHGENLGGDVPLDIPNVVRFIAPNLTEARTHYTDAQLVTLLRKGVRPDGTSVLFMPSEMIRHLNARTSPASSPSCEARHQPRALPERLKCAWSAATFSRAANSNRRRN